MGLALLAALVSLGTYPLTDLCLHEESSRQDDGLDESDGFPKEVGVHVIAGVAQVVREYHSRIGGASVIEFLWILTIKALGTLLSSHPFTPLHEIPPW